MEWDVRRGQNSNEHQNHDDIKDLDCQSHNHYDGCCKDIILILIIIQVIVNVIMIVIKVMDGVADFCIADISITSPRAKAFTFSMPWLVNKLPPPPPLPISQMLSAQELHPTLLLTFLSPKCSTKNQVKFYTVQNPTLCVRLLTV